MADKKRRTEQMIWEVLTAIVAPSTGRCAKRSARREGCAVTTLEMTAREIPSPGSRGVATRKLPPAMTINPAIVRIVDFCARYRWMIVIAGTLLMLGAAAFDATQFSIDADIEGLISQNLPWHQRELQLLHAFPQKGILVVVKAPTAENAEQATNALAQTLSKNHDLFPAVQQLDSGDFFERNGSLYQSSGRCQKKRRGTGEGPALHFSARRRSQSSRRYDRAFVCDPGCAGRSDQAGAAGMASLPHRSNTRGRSVRESGQNFLAGAVAR